MILGSLPAWPSTRFPGCLALSLPCKQRYLGDHQDCLGDSSAKTGDCNPSDFITPVIRSVDQGWSSGRFFAGLWCAREEASGCLMFWLDGWAECVEVLHCLLVATWRSFWKMWWFGLQKILVKNCSWDVRRSEQSGFFLTGRCTSVWRVTISYYFCGGAFARVKAGYLFHEEDHCLNCPTPWFRAADFLFGLFWQCQELLQLWLRCKDEMVEWLSRGAVFSHLILNIADNVGFGECTSHFPNVSNLPWWKVWKVEAQPAEITEVSRCLPCAGGRALVASLL